MAYARHFHDLDPDDVFSIAMEAAWKSVRLPDVQQIIPTRNLIFKRHIHDLRRAIWAQKRTPRRCRSLGQDDQGEDEPVIDPSSSEPLDILCAHEELAPQIAFLEAHGYPPAPPCSHCGTLGGLIRHDGTAPRRTAGLCHRCYQLTRRHRARDLHP